MEEGEAAMKEWERGRMADGGVSGARRVTCMETVD